MDAATRSKAPPFAAQRMGHPVLLNTQPDGLCCAAVNKSSGINGACV